MIGLTYEQIERAWSNNAKMRVNFKGDFSAYKQYMQSNAISPEQLKTPRPVTPPVVSQQKIEEPNPMPKPTYTAEQQAALDQIAAWKREDQQKVAMARMAPVNPEQAWRSEFSASTALQKEFRAVDVFVAYKRAQSRGLCK